MTDQERDKIQDAATAISRLAAILDLIALGTEMAGADTPTDAAIDGAADFARSIGTALNEFM